MVTALRAATGELFADPRQDEVGRPIRRLRATRTHSSAG